MSLTDIQSLAVGETLSQHVEDWFALSDAEMSMLSETGSSLYAPPMLLASDMEDELAGDVLTPLHVQDSENAVPLGSQVGGSKRPRTPPPTIYPTHLRTRISPSKVDQGLIKTASDRRSRLVGTETLDPRDLNMQSVEHVPMVASMEGTSVPPQASEGVFCGPPRASGDVPSRRLRAPRDASQEPLYTSRDA